jgi:hypothetical protein
MAIATIRITIHRFNVGLGMVTLRVRSEVANLSRAELKKRRLHRRGEKARDQFLTARAKWSASGTIVFLMRG